VHGAVCHSSTSQPKRPVDGCNPSAGIQEPPLASRLFLGPEAAVDCMPRRRVGRGRRGRLGLGRRPWISQGQTGFVRLLLALAVLTSLIGRIGRIARCDSTDAASRAGLSRRLARRRGPYLTGGRPWIDGFSAGIVLWIAAA
jgi:hypothetical protein